MTRLATATRAFLCLSLASCATAPGDEVVADRVTVIDREPGTEIMVGPGRLVLPTAGNEDLLDRVPGDILVSGRGAGFLRRVVSIQDAAGEIQIATEPAALTDAITEAEYDGQVHDAKWDWSGPKFGGVLLGFGGVEMQGNGNAKLTMTKGSLDFHPQLDLAMTMHRAKISRFDLVASGVFDAALGFKLETDGAAEIKTSRDLWASPEWTFVQMVGPVPVVEVVSITVGLEVNASTEGQTSMQVGATAHSTLSAGARFSDGVWHHVGDHTLVLHTDGPTVTSTNNAQVKISMPIELHVQFYDLAGPYVAIEPSLQAEYKRGEGVTASWGTEAVVGGQVNLLGAGNDSRLLGIEASLFDFSCDFGTPVRDCLN